MLYELDQNLKTLLEMFQEDETSNEDILLALQITEADRSQKLENYVKFIRNLEAEMDSCKNEIEKLKQKAKTKENKINSLKRVIHNSMNLFNHKKEKAGLFNITIKESDKVDISESFLDKINQAQISFSDSFTQDLFDKKILKLKLDISKTEIKKELKNTEIEGVSISTEEYLFIK